MDDLDGAWEPGDSALGREVDAAVNQVLTRGTRSRAGSWLRRLGLKLESSRVRLDTGFRCSVMGTTLRTDCRLRQCRYHVDYEWSANCLLAYMHQQGVESLSVDEISFLYRIPAEYVKKKIDGAVGRLRTGSIEQQSVIEASLARRFRHMPGARLCVVCESTIEDEVVPKAFEIESIGGRYCSRECRDEKPPRVVELELSKGLPIQQILDWTFRRYRSLSLAEQSLEMPRWMLSEASKRYLGYPLEHFFPALQQVQKQRRSALIRRTWHTPKWVATLTQKLEPLVRDTARKYGPATLDTSGIRNRLEDVLKNV